MSTATIDCADALTWLNARPDDSIDLLFTSPPYLEARTYGIGAGRPLEEWTAWMVGVVRAAAPKVKGLIAVVCEGQTADYRYQPAPYLLMADLHRAGFNLRRPAAYRRVGIPGSGGPDWLRCDWEPVVCVTRPGRLPWSDNTACGHPPKWAPGGEMSHRLSDGTRVNQWGPVGSPKGGGNKNADGDVKQERGRKSHKTFTIGSGKRANGDPKGRAEDREGYEPPALANPGNVVNRLYTAEEVAELMGVPADVRDCHVGGGQMGSPLAHHNEAPFPLELAEFFVLSFCPPGGTVCDCFVGSGTTAHAAVLHGREFVGCDVRESQVALARRRLASVTPSLFGGVA